MKTGKKVSITILSVLILALCAVGIIRSTTFPMDPATLPDHICDFYNIGRPPAPLAEYSGVRQC